MANLRPRARIVRSIGDQLISGTEAALIELMKNAYDADASEVHISHSRRAAVSKINCLDDSLERVLPDSQDSPTGLAKLSVDKPVSLDVARQLLLPERPVVRRHLAMQRTAVPEASVDEHHDPLPPEDKIWPHRQLSLALTLGDPQAQRELDNKVAPPPLDASPPEGRCKHKLGRLVPFAPDAGHDFRTLLGVKDVCHQVPS